MSTIAILFSAMALGLTIIFGFVTAAIYRQVRQLSSAITLETAGPLHNANTTHAGLDGDTAIVLLSQGCLACREIAASLHLVALRYPNTRVMALLRDDARNLTFGRATNLSVSVDRDRFASVAPRVTPYLVIVDTSGREVDGRVVRSSAEVSDALSAVLGD